jgi:secreted trypsin-like serine protease
VNFLIHAAKSAGKIKNVPARQIVNGEDAVLGQFPWQAYILIDSMYICGGSLILEDWVLTAAHCAEAAYSI